MKTRRCDYCGRRRPLKRLEPTDLGVVTAVQPKHCRDLASCWRSAARNTIHCMRQCLDRHSRVFIGDLHWPSRAEARATIVHSKENIAAGGELW